MILSHKTKSYDPHPTDIWVLWSETPVIKLLLNQCIIN